jgi:urease accessory protein
MTNDVLTLSQLLSPSFPVGAFAYSNGLETAIRDEFVSDADSLQAWLTALLDQGGLRSDATLLNAAYGLDDPIVDASARAFASSAERLMETDLQGAAFCDTVSAVWGHDLGRLCYPVAVGRIAAELNLEVELATAMYLQATLSNLIAAAMRLVPLGQVDGQKVQTALKPLCTEIAAQLRGSTLNDLHNAAWLSDIAGMQHETQYSRIFRS